MLVILKLSMMLGNIVEIPKIPASKTNILFLLHCLTFKYPWLLHSQLCFSRPILVELSLPPFIQDWPFNTVQFCNLYLEHRTSNSQWSLYIFRLKSNFENLSMLNFNLPLSVVCLIRFIRHFLFLHNWMEKALML